MFDYTDIGLNSSLRQLNGPGVAGSVMTGMQFDSSYEVQTKRIKTSQSAITNFWNISEVGTIIGVGPYNNGDWVTLTSLLTPQTPYQQKRTFGTPYISVYEGTVFAPASKIYPQQGSNIGNGDYDVKAGFDLSDLDNVNSVFQVNVANLAAGPVSLCFQVLWKYNVDSAGSAS